MEPTAAVPFMVEQPEDDSDVLNSLELLRQAQGGDLTAYERLFERYYSRVLAIVRRRMGGHMRAVQESGDILNDAMLEAFRGFDRFEIRESGALIGYFATIVENCIRKAADHHGAQKRDRAREVALEHLARSIASGSIRLELEGDCELPLDAIERAEQIELMEECLEGLTSDQKRVLLLRQREGASWAAAAEALGLPTPDAARARYMRALVALGSLVRRRFSSD